MLRILGLAVAIVLVLGAGAHAASLVTGAVSVSAGDSLTCTAVNVKNSSIARIRVETTRLEAAGAGPSVATTCSDVAPGHVCSIPAGASSNDFAAYCLIEPSSGKQSVRGMLCNRTTGACSEAR